MGSLGRIALSGQPTGGAHLEVDFDERGRRVISAEQSAEFRRRGWWRDRTAVDDFLDRAAEHPERIAVVSAHPTLDTEPERHTYGELERLTWRAAVSLLRMGIVPGDVVSVQLPNSWQFPAIVYGILRVGAVVNPIVPIFRHRELSFVLERTGSKILFVPDVFRGFDHQAMALDLWRDVESLETVVRVQGFDGGRESGEPATGPRNQATSAEAPSGLLDFDADILASGDSFEAEAGCSTTVGAGANWQSRAEVIEELHRRRPEPDDLMQIQFTSGTTGEPKGVLHSHNTVWSGGRAVSEVYGLDASDTCFMASTLAHQTGFGYGMSTPLSLGMTVVYQDQWDADACLELVEREGVVWTVSATAFAMDLIAAQRHRPRDLSSFRFFICGGAPIPPHVVVEADEVLGASLIAVWGMTENMIVTTTRPGDPVDLVSDSDGTPVDWMEIRVTDPDGRQVAVGEDGDLWCRGPSQALGYFLRPDLYQAASPDGDWFATGDVARVRPDGGIRISGRTKDLIIRGGENVPVAEIEALLYTHPNVAEVAIVGFADERLGERACAVLTAAGSPPPTLDELITVLRDAGTARQFWPERLEVMADMPKTPSGKIQKFRLKELLGLG